MGRRTKLSDFTALFLMLAVVVGVPLSCFFVGTSQTGSPRSTPVTQQSVYSPPPITPPQVEPDQKFEPHVPARFSAPISKPKPKPETPPSYTAPRSVPSSSDSDRVQVKGYYRKDGTYVRPHTRSRPIK